MIDALVPALLLFVCACACRQKADLYSLLQAGAQDGLKTLLAILPPLIVLLAAISMLRASGAMDLLTEALAPFFAFFGIPPETAPLVLIRPFSGSAGLAVGTELMQTYGVDSPIGRTAAVMLGSSESTFYAISVYFGAAGIRDTRYTLPAALIADLVGFVSAALCVRIFG